MAEIFFHKCGQREKKRLFGKDLLTLTVLYPHVKETQEQPTALATIGERLKLKIADS